MARSRRTAEVVKLDDVISSLAAPPFENRQDSALIGGSTKDPSPITAPEDNAEKTICRTPKAATDKPDAARISPSRRNSPSPSPTRDTDAISTRRYNPRLNKIEETPTSNAASAIKTNETPTGTSKSDPGPGPTGAFGVDKTHPTPSAFAKTVDLERRLKQKDAQINHLINKLDTRDEQIEDLRAKIDKIQSLLLIVEVRKKFDSDLCVNI